MSPESESESELEALRRENERLRFAAARDRRLLDLVLEQSPHGVIMSDAHGRLVLHNDAAERIWGGSATAENVTDWSRYRAFHPDGRPYEGRDWPMARCLETQDLVEAAEFRIQRFDDSYGWLVGSSAPLLSDDGQLLGAVSVFVDVTALKESAAQNRRRALEIHDDVVQSVSAARMAFDLGRADEVRDSLAVALAAARNVVNDLLGEEAEESFAPGSLRRAEPTEPA
ncbi:MAG TPA: PAS domain-containing protein [Gaiellaceae bacterium]|nr:PAS domain-containing protein [Gaiellaceae bacterium]